MLQKISLFDYYKGIGIKAYTDGYSHDEYGYLYLVSIIGHDSAVKGLSSAVVTLRDVTIELNKDDEISLCAMPGEKYRILSTRLDSGFLHQIVVMEAILDKASNKLVYIGDKNEIGDVIFSTIRKNFSTPLLPDWKGWLIKQITEQELIEVMQGNIKLAKINLKEKELDSIISDGIKKRNIRF